MRTLLILLVSLLLLVDSATAQSLPSAPQPSAQQDDQQWDRLSFLDPGSQVSVTSNRGRIRCTNVHVTDEGFSCEFGSIFLPRRYVELSRSDVLEVRRRHDDRSRMIFVGAAIAIGYGLGYANANGSSRNFNGGIGALVFGTVSVPVSRAFAYLMPGHLLYRK
jgi:hypothetical protein